MAITEQGYIASAELRLDTLPVEGNTVGIGADTYYFGTPGGSEIPVAIGATPAEALGNLVTAINGSGTVDVKAAARGTFVRIESADAPGGTPQTGTPDSTPLSATLALGTNVWNALDLNELGEEPTKKTSGSRLVSSQNLLGDDYRISLGLTPIRATVIVVKGTKRTRSWPYTFDGTDLVIPKQLAGGARRLRPSDVIQWTVWGN
jgi:hypothetical protein